MISREPIYAALFAKLAASSAFNLTSRRLQHWTDVAPADQPSLFMTQRKELAQTTPGLNTEWTLMIDVYIYVNTQDDKTVAPGTLINPLLDAVTTALAPDDLSKNKCTLGGLVQHVWIEGEIQTDEGVLGDQGVAVIPIAVKYA